SATTAATLNTGAGSFGSPFAAFAPALMRCFNSSAVCDEADSGDPANTNANTRAKITRGMRTPLGHRPRAASAFCLSSLDSGLFRRLGEKSRLSVQIDSDRIPRGTKDTRPGVGPGRHTNSSKKIRRRYAITIVRRDRG